MFALSNYSIRARLYGVAGLAMCTMLLIGGMGLHAVYVARDNFSQYVANDVQGFRSLADVRADVGRLRRHEKDVFLNVTDPAAVARYSELWVQTHGRVVVGLKGLDKLALPENLRQAPKEMLALLDAYEQALRGVMQLIKSGSVSDTAGANQAMEPVKGPVRQLDERLESFTQKLDAYGDAHVEELRVAEKRKRLVLMIAMGFGVVATALGTVFNIRSILAPLNQAMASAQRIGDKDLSVAINTRGRDETATLMAGMARMQDSIGEVVRDVRRATDSIAVASKEVAMGSQDLSERTENAASSLEETASAMEQLTASVSHNADSARQASELSSSAADVAHRGGAVVSEVVETMQRISSSSRQISDIISVIDGIAFQTNILALNAAVEAARAGEQGRGFAVVASEVRALAGRSAEAAKQIKTLITASSESVDSGAKLVARAGETMKDIVSAIERVNHMVSEISSATREQSAGINQIGQAISKLDEMTQQNAALVEQSAAAAASLQDQATELASSVGVFKLD